MQNSKEQGLVFPEEHRHWLVKENKRREDQQCINWSFANSEPQSFHSSEMCTLHCYLHSHTHIYTQQKPKQNRLQTTCSWLIRNSHFYNENFNSLRTGVYSGPPIRDYSHRDVWKKLSKITSSVGAETTNGVICIFKMSTLSSLTIGIYQRRITSFFIIIFLLISVFTLDVEQFLLFALVVIYKLTMNAELVNTESILWEIQSWVPRSLWSKHFINSSLQNLVLYIYF